jgi:hypothetical protein
MTRARLAAAVAVTGLIVVAAAAAVAVNAGPPAQAADPRERYEVWLVDQTDSQTGFGGYLHVFAGSALERDAARAQPQTYDLGAQAADLCRASTGANPVRPHMLIFKGGDAQTVEGSSFAILSWVVSGHVTIHDAATREAIACLRTSPGANGARQAHAAWPSADGRHIVVSNQNGKLVERIRADWQARTFTWEPDAALSLFEGTTPSGAARQDPVLRPDNAPICTRTTRDNRFAFVSLRGGGAFVIDHTATPMRIVAEYDRATIDDNGCGQQETGDTMYLNAGAGAPGDRFGHAVYAVDMTQLQTQGTPPNTPAPALVYRREGEVDAHGVALTKHEKYLLVGDRIQNDVTVVDTRKDRVVGSYSLAGPLSSDPAPDLLDLSPDDKLAFFALRGPAPLTGGQDALGATPGLGVVELGRGGKDGELEAIARAPRPVTDPRPPDPHTVAVRVLR